MLGIGLLRLMGLSRVKLQAYCQYLQYFVNWAYDRVRVMSKQKLNDIVDSSYYLSIYPLCKQLFNNKITTLNEFSRFRIKHNKMIRKQKKAIMRQNFNHTFNEGRNAGNHGYQKQNQYHIGRKNRLQCNGVRNNRLDMTTPHLKNERDEQNILRQQNNRELSRSKSIKSQTKLKRFNPNLSPPAFLTPTPNLSQTLPIHQSQSCSKFLLSDETQRNIRSNRKISSLNYNYLHQLQNGGSQTSRASNCKQWQIQHRIQSQHIESMQNQIQHLLKFVHQKKKRDVMDYRRKNQERDKIMIEKTVEQQNQGEREINEGTFSKISEQWGRASSGTNFTEKLIPFQEIKSTVLPQRQNIYDQEILHDFYNNYNKIKKITEQTQIKKNQGSRNKFSYSLSNRNSQLNLRQKNIEKSRQMKKMGNNAIQGKNSWIDLPEVNSSYIEVIDKEIEKIKGKIMDSERITRQMQNKYLYTENRKLENQKINSDNNIQTPRLAENSFSRTFNRLENQRQLQKSLQRKEIRIEEQKQFLAIQNQKPIIKQISTPKQNLQKRNMKGKKNQITEFQQINASLMMKLASLLAQQAELDVEMREWRQYAKVVCDRQNKKKQSGNNQEQILWSSLITILAQEGYHYTQFQLKDILTMASCETNPLAKLKNPPDLQSIISNLSRIFLRSQTFWHSEVIGCINRNQANACNFTFNFLDLSKKGQISIEDVVCFVNLYAGKFYRNRDFVMMFKRILQSNGKNMQQKFLQYSDFQSIIYDNY